MQYQFDKKYYFEIIILHQYIQMSDFTSSYSDTVNKLQN